MVRKTISEAQGHFSSPWKKKKEKETSKLKLTFNINCNLVFQNTENTLQELHLLLAPDNKHKRYF